LLRVNRYSKRYKSEWNDFVNSAKNATFLFQREFMEYHNDRFEDYSLMIFKGEKLIALLPANINNGVLHSHQGLTFGGLLLSTKATFENALNAWKALLVFLEEQQFKTLQLKLIPKIYHLQASDEIDYLLFKLNAKNSRKDITSVIISSNRLPIESSNRKRGIKKALKNDLIIEEVDDFKVFWKDVLIPNLQESHKAKPVHTASEITDLKSKFPNNIKQFNVFYNEETVAGVTIFETETVAHIQYISASSEGKKLGSLDFLINFLINEKYAQKKYFDFGISNENQGKNINKGLLNWKESFGARSVIHDFYEIETRNHLLLNDLFI